MDMNYEEAELPISHPIDVTGIPNEGTHVRIEADEEEMAGLAKLCGLQKVLSVSALLHVKPWRKAGILVDGTVDGRVVQTCVVTLDPVEQDVSEAVLLRYTPSAAKGRETSKTEIEIDPQEEDPPETFDGMHLDLGPIVCEAFALGLDPYPRRDGIEYDPPAEEAVKSAVTGENSPFAALSKLKGK